uniref:Uncharacterized protein n=1 Tax=Octopus bimaculoides TaxID=37653 RepID=A0A0L8FT64_OCTBM
MIDIVRLHDLILECKYKYNTKIGIVLLFKSSTMYCYTQAVGKIRTLYSNVYALLIV